MRNFAKGFVAALLCVAAVGLVLLLSGWYNVAATQPHSEFGRWVLQTAMRRSVEVRAEGITGHASPQQDAVRRGAQHFAHMCVVCHGAPGVERGEIGRGLRPEPPDLAKAAPEWTPKELYWILRNGIRMTGMPAWGATHKDETLWDLVSFLGRLPTMTSDEYAGLTAEAAAGHKPSSHER